jgi:vancomycin resistance protein YoaR
MTVSYVDLAYDAAIAEGSKNFRFSNNTDMPILIESFSDDRKITFRIWGHETRDMDKRTIKFENKVIKETAPPSTEEVTKDPTRPTSYRKVTQSAKRGYTAELYKVVYENGVEVSRELINRSNYNAEPAHVTIGTKKK